MFESPARLKFEGKPHFVLHHPDGGFTLPTLPVTAEMLRKHTRKFGPEGVEEVARWEGVSLDREIASKLRPKRRTTDGLERWVLNLASDGMLVSGIARTTNTGIGRVKSILRKHGVELRRGVTSLPMDARADLRSKL